MILGIPHGPDDAGQMLLRQPRLRHNVASLHLEEKRDGGTQNAPNIALPDSHGNSKFRRQCQRLGYQ